MNIAMLFQGISTLFAVDTATAVARVVLIILGIVLIILGTKNVLEPLIMVPMGFGMIAINCAVLYVSATEIGNIFVDPMVTDVSGILDALQVDFLQPIYTLTFSNGLIACLVFMGIGVMTDVSCVLAFPFTSMLIAFCAELGTLLIFPIAVSMGFIPEEAASIALIGGADGPMVLFSSLIMAKDLFVPITIVAYLYLSLTYGGYPFLIRLLIPKKLRAIKMERNARVDSVTRAEKLAFAIVACVVLCLLFPVAAPLFMSFFLGVAIREAGITKYVKLLEETVLYVSTFFLGLLLGVLCDASTILDPAVVKLLILGMLALLISGIGGILGGYLVYFLSGKRFNPTIGIAGVSCVPTTAKVAQKEVTHANKQAVILPYALAANVSGVITTAILTGLYVSFLG
ncbi:MAG: sodium ion-translocating decarboxylase subunit beta [Lachnospiraceae bacterium]|nr:sodium ion-translocating decarboxylase subunit beta [Lachnospiraceae bacterium]